MDLLYSRYASPMDFMRTYIDQGRFGEFVTNILEMEYKRKKEAAEKEDERKLWEMYIHSEVNESFNDWKARVLQPVKAKAKTGGDTNMTDKDIENIIDRLFPKG